MSVRSAVMMQAKPGQEAAYRDWVQRSSMATLGPVFARVGVRAKTILMADRWVLAHYEADTADAVGRAFGEPEAGALLGGVLAQLLDLSVAPIFYSEEFHWTHKVDAPLQRAAISLSLKTGKNPEYMRWLKHKANQQFTPLWRRFDVGVKEVLVSGTDVVSYYEIKDVERILPSFGDPDALAAMQTELGALLDIDAAKPPVLLREVFHWHE